jgi:hypothetical protein
LKKARWSLERRSPSPAVGFGPSWQRPFKSAEHRLLRRATSHLAIASAAPKKMNHVTPMIRLPFTALAYDTSAEAGLPFTFSIDVLHST